MSSIEVSVRLRPFNQREMKYDSKLIIGMEGNCTEVSVVRNGKITSDPPRKFFFDHNFWTHEPGAERFADQKMVYETMGKKILDNSFQGFNSCLFAYGQTGSGKTYSMMGIASDPGVIPRLCQDLFGRADAMKETHTLTVECSYLEIYNEEVKDLLNPQRTTPMKVRQHPKMGVYVDGLTKIICKGEADVMELLDEGGKVRSIAATQMNATSSRSHAILTLTVRIVSGDANLASRLNLVDLAGSERATSTGATGDTLTEGANINKSLTTLGMCLARLAEVADGKTKGHVPFRDSQLTWLLNDSLGGNSKTAMLANISPADINFEETLSTLRFASIVKKIKNNAVVNEDPQQKLIRELRQEIIELKEKLSNCKAKKLMGKFMLKKRAAAADKPAAETTEEATPAPAPAAEPAAEAKAAEAEPDGPASPKHVDPVPVSEPESAAETTEEPSEAVAAPDAKPAEEAPADAVKDEVSAPSDESQPVAESSAAPEAAAEPTDAKPQETEPSSAAPEPAEPTQEATSPAADDAAASPTSPKAGGSFFPMLWKPKVPGVEEGQDEEADLMAELKRNTLLVMEATETDEDRIKRSERVNQNRREAMKKVAAQIVPNFSLPRLVTLNEDLHNFPGVALMYYIQEGANRVGSSDKEDNYIHLNAVSTVWPSHCVIECNALQRTITLVTVPQPEDTPHSKDHRTFVNGTAVGAAPVPLSHLDRIFIGPLAFRVSLPQSWHMENADEFARVPITARHAELLENHQRLETEVGWIKGLDSIVSNAEELDGLLPNTEALSEALRELMYGLAESETKLVNDYPAGEAPETPTTDHAEHSYDYNYACKERERVVQAQQRQKAEAAREKMAKELQNRADEKDEEIGKLREMLLQKQHLEDKEQEAAEAARREALEAQLAEAKRAKEEREREKQERAEAKRLAKEAAAAERARAKEERERARQERREKAAAAAAEAAAANAALPVTEATPEPEPEEEEEEEEVEEVVEEVDEVEEDPQDYFTSPTSPRVVVPESQKERLQAAKELAVYEEECRDAQEWKPLGPTDAQDAAEYQTAIKFPTLAKINELGDIQMEGALHKLRVKKGLFKRHGFHKVHGVLRGKFFYYFASNKPSESASGSAYLYGATLHTLEPSDGKQFVMRIDPCVPRKPNKFSKGDAELGVTIGFDTQEQMNSWKAVMEQASVPPMPPSVSQYIRDRKSTVTSSTMSSS